MAASEKADKGPPQGATQEAAHGVTQEAAHGATQERFDEILTRLRGVVEKLEGGNLSLEDSLKFFEEGIGLCRRGATILDSAERKVEVLLGGTANAPGPQRTAPFETPTGDDR
jgi:exodeoxyribonuclease VII small subunit